MCRRRGHQALAVWHGAGCWAWGSDPHCVFAGRVGHDTVGALRGHDARCTHAMECERLGGHETQCVLAVGRLPCTSMGAARGPREAHCVHAGGHEAQCAVERGRLGGHERVSVRMQGCVSGLGATRPRVYMHEGSGLGHEVQCVLAGERLGGNEAQCLHAGERLRAQSVHACVRVWGHEVPQCVAYADCGRFSATEIIV
jgi:hypothetical protein